MGLFRGGGRILGKLIDISRALTEPGAYIPAVHETNAAGETIVVRPEIVVPQGPLRSTTILFALGTVITTTTGIIAMLKAGIPDQVAFDAAVAADLTAAGTIWRHIRSWMPVKGMADPKPTVS